MKYNKDDLELAIEIARQLKNDEVYWELIMQISEPYHTKVTRDMMN